MRLFITSPPVIEQGLAPLAQAIRVLHQSLPTRRWIAFGYEKSHGELGLTVDAPRECQPILQAQLYAAYPEARIDEAEPLSPSGIDAWSANLRLRPDVFPLRSVQRLADPLDHALADPVTTVLATTDDRSKVLTARIELWVRPASRRRISSAHRTVTLLQRNALESHPSLARIFLWLRTHSVWIVRRFAIIIPLLGRAAFWRRRADDIIPISVEDLARKTTGPLFEATLRVVVSGPAAAERLARRKLREITGAFAGFIEPLQSAFEADWIRPVRRLLRWPCPRFLLSPDDLALLWHPPLKHERTPSLARTHFREPEPEAHLPSSTSDPDVAVVGESVFRGKATKCGLLPDDRRRHLLLLGKTGMGKSTLLLQLLSSDIAAGRGVGLLDPHGDLCESLLRFIPSRRTNDVVLFDAGDTQHPPAFNPLHCPDDQMRPLLVSGVVSAFQRVFGDSWGPRLEHVLRNSVLALLDMPDSTLVSLQRLLSDARYRNDVVHRARDPVARAFWQRELAGMAPRLQAEALSPVQNKIGQFVSNPILRNIVGQPQSRLDLRRIMDDGKILLCNLSKGRVGDDGSQLLGAFLMTSIQLAVMGRADVPEARRREFFLTVDEFGSFATESFASALSEARKYGLALSLANQYLAQLESATLSAVFGNVGSLLVFQVGAEDADALTAQLGEGLEPRDLLNLSRYHAYARLLVEGRPARPFLLRTLATPAKAIDPQRADIIRRVSRRALTRDARSVDADIQRMLV